MFAITTSLNISENKIVPQISGIIWIFAFLLFNVNHIKQKPIFGTFLSFIPCHDTTHQTKAPLEGKGLLWLTIKGDVVLPDRIFMIVRMWSGSHIVFIVRKHINCSGILSVYFSFIFLFRSMWHRVVHTLSLSPQLNIDGSTLLHTIGVL